VEDRLDGFAFAVVAHDPLEDDERAVGAAEEAPSQGGGVDRIVGEVAHFRAESLSLAKTRDHGSTCADRATEDVSRRCSADPSSSRGINYGRHPPATGGMKATSSPSRSTASGRT